MEKDNEYFDGAIKGLKDATNMVNKKTRIRELEEIIQELDTEFELGEDCIDPISLEIISDNQYDSLKRELYVLDKNSKIFEMVTSSRVEVVGKNKVVHNPCMTSINKCNAETEEEKFEILEKWFKDCRKIGEDVEFSMSYKIDGLACSLIFKSGELIQAGLRSKSGVDGIKITKKTKYIKNIPHQLEIPVSCVIRGEIETSKSMFKKQCEILGEKEKKANPRAHSCGSMNLKIPEQMKNRGLEFTAYNVLNLENPPFKTEIGMRKWVTETLKLKFVETIPFSFEKLKEMEENHRKKDSLIDGIVLSVNNLELQEKLGRTGGRETGNLKGKLAWKFKDEIKKTTVLDIKWNTGRTGTVCPILIIEKIQLEGTQVSKCTAHNLGIIKDNKIGVGTIIEIIKSGKIIPKIKKIVESKGDSLIPEFCPSCNNKLIEIEGNNNTLSLNCNNKSCPAQNIKMLNHYLNILGIKGISEKTIEKIIETGLLKKRSDFYKLDFNKLIEAGFTERTAILIDARIQMIENSESIKNNDKLIEMVLKKHKEFKNIPIEKFIASLGIQEAGNTIGMILEKKYNDFEIIKNLTIEELKEIDGIGETIAFNIHNFFKENKEEINILLKSIRLETKMVKSNELEGKIFVLSGKLEMGKAYWKLKIEEQGGICKSSVGKSVNFVIAAEGSGLKTKKALELGIPVLTTNDLEEMLNN